MVTARPPREEIIYEQSEHIPDHGRLFFITVVLHDTERKSVALESHVFIPQESLHLHQLKVCPRGCAEGDAALLARGLEATHRVFADQLARDGNEHALGQKGFRYATRQMEVHPFHGFHMRSQFRDQMWEIQDWTISPTLRESLAQITRSRTETSEAELRWRFSAKD